MKGKNFSCNNNGERNKHDMYQTPYSIIEQLLENEKFDYNKTVLEPACGKKAISLILEKKFNYVISTDIEFNFLQNEFVHYDYIITNPPFSLAFEFIQKAKEIAKEKFAMLLPLSYLHGKKRYESKIFRDENYPLTKVYVFTRYPLLEKTIREDGKYKTGMQVYMWAIFEKNNSQIKIHNIPLIKWINNDEFVLREKDELSKNL